MMIETALFVVGSKCHMLLVGLFGWGREATDRRSHQQVLGPVGPHPSPSTLRVLSCFTWPFVGVSFGLPQPLVDDFPHLKPDCRSSPFLQGLLASQALPSVAKGGRCTWVLAYPPGHSRRDDRNPYFFTLELFEHGGAWQVADGQACCGPF